MGSCLSRLGRIDRIPFAGGGRTPQPAGDNRVALIGRSTPAGSRGTLFFLLMGLGQAALLSLGWSRLKTGEWIPFYPLRKGARAAGASA